MYEFNSNEYHKMVHAFLFMKNGLHNDRYISSRNYQHLKEINAKYLSDSRKGISTGLQWVHNKELHVEKMIFKNSVLEEGWSKGKLTGIPRSPETIEKIKNSIKNNTLKQNPRLNTITYYNLELEINKAFKQDEIVPDGWYKGMVKDWVKFKSRKCLVCKGQIHLIIRKAKYCSEDCRNNSTKRCNTLWIYNIQTLKVTKIKKDVQLPIGFQYGRGPKEN